MRYSREMVWALSAVPGILIGQTPGSAACTPAVGWSVKDCANCMITADEEVQYLVEPTLRGVDTTVAGPARGMLRDGDVLVAVNDQLITTAPAWQLIHGAQRDSRQLTLTVRRGGSQLTVPVIPQATCAQNLKDQVERVVHQDADQLPKVGPVFSMASSVSPDTVQLGLLSNPRRIIPNNPSLANLTWMSNNGTPSPGTAEMWLGGAPTELSPAATHRLRSLPGGSPEPRLGLGVECARCSATYSSDLTPVYSFAEAPIVDYVAPDSPADHAGIRVGDTIAAVNNIPITSERGGRLFSLVAPNEQITLRVLHGPDTRTVALTAAPPPLENSQQAGTAGGTSNFHIAFSRQTDLTTAAAPNASKAPPPSPTTQEFYVGGVRISIDGGFKRMDFDAKTQEMIFTFSDGHIVRIKAIEK